MIRLLHAADLHMDSPFRGLSEEQAALRRREQRDLLYRLCEIAEREGAELLLLAGDLFDSTVPYAETAQTLFSALGSLSIPVLIAPGNHDHYSLRSPYARFALPDNVTVFTRAALSCRDLPSLGVRIWGAGYESTSCPPLLRGFSLPREDELLNILLLHGELTASESPYCPVTERELAESGFDYVALGHTHRASGLCYAGKTPYAWPGCAEGRGFDETGEKGVYLIELERGACGARFIPLGGRRYEILRLDDREELARTLLRSLPVGAERDVTRIVLTGESCGTSLSELRGALEGHFFALELRDERTLPIELWEHMHDAGLRGTFLRKLRERYDRAENESERARIELAARAGLAAMEGREEP